MADAETQSNEHVKVFFLDLAAKGKDVWNAWRRDPANNDVRVTFAGTDFSKEKNDQINFSGFEFGDEADFSQCKWRGGWTKDPETFVPGPACFIGAAFGAGANFRGAAFGSEAKFTGAAFGDLASFDGSAFDGFASFDGVTFGYPVSFDEVAFGDGAVGGGTNFKGAAFGVGASFIDAVFHRGGTSFKGAAFDDEASFTSADFGWDANFDGAAFGTRARFKGAAFGVGASFKGAAFGDDARFDRAVFGSNASFAGAAFSKLASFNQAHFKGHVQFTRKSTKQWSDGLELCVDESDEKGKEVRIALKERHEESWERFGSGPDRFLTMSFANARFGGEADFSGRTFERVADFTKARFYYPPNFDAVTNASLIDFTGAYIGFVLPGNRAGPERSEILLRLRAFRKIAEDTKNHDLERDLYIEERKAERGVYLVQRFEDLKKDGWKNWPTNAARLFAHILWIAVTVLYAALADYGRSFVRPFAWLIGSGFFFYWRYLVTLTPLMAKASATDMDKYKHAVRMLALGNTVPFVGPLTIDADIKKFLFCPGFGPCLPIPPEGYQLLVLSQNLLSITLVFFIGLALRNYFKIK